MAVLYVCVCAFDLALWYVCWDSILFRHGMQLSEPTTSLHYHRVNSEPYNSIETKLSKSVYQSTTRALTVKRFRSKALCILWTKVWCEGNKKKKASKSNCNMTISAIYERLNEKIFQQQQLKNLIVNFMTFHTKRNY